MKVKNFKTVGGEEKRLALTSGHVYIVTPSWTPLPETAWPTAYSCQCISEDMITGTGNLQAASETMASISEADLLEAEVSDVIRAAMELGEDSFFAKSTGVPKIASVSAALGKDVPGEVVRTAWSKISTEDAEDLALPE